MVKFILSGILLVHGLIHLLGFVKAFRLAPIDQLTKEITKPIGLLWLVCAVLFILIFILYFINHGFWAHLALMTILLSQMLIIHSWSDAKVGTIANIIILAMAIPSIGAYYFNKMVHEERMALLSEVSDMSNAIISEGDLAQVPKIVKKWMIKSGVVGQEKVSFVRLRQTGQMKTKSDGKWMNFDAEQYFDVHHASFVWTTNVHMMPMISLCGRDKLIDGKGQMLIKLLSLITVVNEGPNHQTDTGTMLRYLGELCWFPAGALNEYISWQELTGTSALATLTINDISVQGTFNFDNDGLLKSFEAERYYGGGKEAKLEKWVVENIDFKTFNGYLIPYRSKVIWKLKEGDFNWLNLEIVDLEVNKRELYPD